MAWTLVGLCLIWLIILLSGCCSREQQAVEIISEARVLLEDPHAGAPRWEVRRGIFLDDAAAFIGSDQ
jgi:hypothetical protein